MDNKFLLTQQQLEQYSNGGFINYCTDYLCVFINEPYKSAGSLICTVQLKYL